MAGDFHVGEAMALTKSNLLREIFDEIEHAAIEMAVHAYAEDDESRRTAMNEVRAIRNVREKLKDLAEAKATLSRTRVSS